MHIGTMRVAMRRAVVYLVALLLCLGPAPAVHAQDAGQAGIASGGETVLLRESPGYDAVALTDVPDGSALDVTGAPATAADGTSWLPVAVNGQSGYVPAGYVTSEPAPAAEPAEWAPEAAPAAESAEWVPEADPAVETTEWSPEPAPVADAALPAPVTAAPVADPALAAPAVELAAPAADPAASGATTTAAAHLLAWPSVDAEIVSVLPPGSLVSVTGAAENGFVPVSGNGLNGWLAADLVSSGAMSTLPPPVVATDTMVAPAPADPAAAPISTNPVQPGATEPVESIAPPPDLSTGQSTGIIWPFSGGEWEVVQGYNNGTHTNRGGMAQYQYALDWARSDGNTAGQPVYAPVSGTIKWTDRGSGGMLIDAGNGYGVAVFHVTIDRGFSRGGSVERGQQIGTISGPGGDGYMSMAHIDMTVWRLSNGGNEAVPFSGPNAISGQEFPDTGGANQYMGVTVAP